LRGEPDILPQQLGEIGLGILAGEISLGTSGVQRVAPSQDVLERKRNQTLSPFGLPPANVGAQARTRARGMVSHAAWYPTRRGIPRIGVGIACSLSKSAALALSVGRMTSFAPSRTSATCANQ